MDIMSIWFKMFLYLLMAALGNLMVYVAFRAKIPRNEYLKKKHIIAWHLFATVFFLVPLFFELIEDISRRRLIDDVYGIIGFALIILLYANAVAYGILLKLLEKKSQWTINLREIRIVMHTFISASVVCWTVMRVCNCVMSWNEAQKHAIDFLNMLS